MRRSGPLRRRTPLKRGGPLRRQSRKRRLEQALRAVTLARLREERGPWCQAQLEGICDGRSVDGHELLTRGRGGSITDGANILLVCRACHDWITAHPVDAAERGLLIPSWQPDSEGEALEGGRGVRVTLGDKLTGPRGEATELLIEHEPSDTVDVQGTVAAWWLDCPGQVALNAWRYYLLGIIHLREIDGAKPAVIRVRHATHEVFVTALDPARNPSPTDPTTWGHLHPFNVAEQVELPSDDAARSLARMCADAVVYGTLPAEPWHPHEPWRTSLIRTSAHLRGEPHAPGGVA